MRAQAEKIARLPMQVRALLDHPANRHDRVGAMKRWLAWQIGARLVPGPVAVPFIDNSRLLISPGLAGGTGNIHFGLAEYNDMAFALHLLRPGDLFVDAGANIGAYSVLAATVGAEVVAFEPIAAAADRCDENIRLNDYATRIELHRHALGSSPGVVTMTDEFDAMNRVVTGRAGVQVMVETLDSVLGARAPLLIKIDVEGYEPEVLRGASRVLRMETLLAVIVEINGSFESYGFSRSDVEGPLHGAGFFPCVYEPAKRRLDQGLGTAGNVIFVRDLDVARARLQAAPHYRIASGML